jgi:ABC-type branched-subunit amino acid transport system ATPase component
VIASVTFRNFKALRSARIELSPFNLVIGPNGSGKSTLASVLAGRKDYEVTEGSVTFNGEDLLEMEPEITTTDAVGEFRNIKLAHNFINLRIEQNMLRSRDGCETKVAYKVSSWLEAVNQATQATQAANAPQATQAAKAPQATAAVKANLATVATAAVKAHRVIKGIQQHLVHQAMEEERQKITEIRLRTRKKRRRFMTRA